MSHQKADHIEKFKTITTEVFALTIGLGAFSLSTIPRESLLDVVWAVATFATSFFYIVIIWMVHSRFFDEYPLYDEAFLGLNLRARVKLYHSTRNHIQYLCELNISN